MTAVLSTSLESSDHIKVSFSKIFVPEEPENSECAYNALKKSGINSPELESLTKQLEEEIKKTPIIWKLSTFTTQNKNISYAQCPSNILKWKSDDESTWFKPGDKLPENFLPNTNIISWDTEPETCLPEDFESLPDRAEPTVLAFHNGKCGIYSLKGMAEGKYKN